MQQRALILLLVFGLTIAAHAQNRVFERSPNLSFTEYFDDGNGGFLVVQSLKWNFDSTHYHLSRSDADHNLTHIGGMRFLSGLTWLNTASKVDDGVIMAGADLGFFTRPMVARMDTTGAVAWSIMFDENDLHTGQYQIHSSFVHGNELDLFTWADNVRPIFNMLNGNIDGTNFTGLEVASQEFTEFRVNDVAEGSVPGSYLVLTQTKWDDLSTNISLIGIDASGVQWAKHYDHGSVANILEFTYGLIGLTGGDFVHVVGYYEPNSQYRLVRTDASGDLVWAREYYLNAEKMLLGAPLETSDGGLILTASTSTGIYALKTDADGVVQWSKEYVQDLTTAFPLGWPRRVGNKILGWSSTVLSEWDEDLNVCDMQPHSGITSQLVTPTITTANIATNPRTHTPIPYSYEARTASLQNTESCLFTGVEGSNALPLSIYPNPASGDHLNITLPVRCTATCTIWDLHGQIVMNKLIKGTTDDHMDIRSLPTGIYMVDIRGEQFHSRSRLVRH